MCRGSDISVATPGHAHNDVRAKARADVREAPVVRLVPPEDRVPGCRGVDARAPHSCSERRIWRYGV